MADKPTSGEILGVPYNFERPSFSRMLSSYWKPGESMIVEKPFGIGYTLNLANWRAWIVVAVAGILLWQESKSGAGGGQESQSADPIEVIVDDES